MSRARNALSPVVRMKGAPPCSPQDSDRAAYLYGPRGDWLHVRQPASGDDPVEHRLQPGVGGDHQLEGVGRVDVVS